MLIIKRRDNVVNKLLADYYQARVIVINNRLMTFSIKMSFLTLVAGKNTIWLIIVTAGLLSRTSVTGGYDEYIIDYRDYITGALAAGFSHNTRPGLCHPCAADTGNHRIYYLAAEAGIQTVLIL
jgi:hypothetical protein